MSQQAVWPDGTLVQDPSLSRERLRSKRKRLVRAKTVNVERLPHRDLEIGKVLNPDVEGVDRPKTRGDCEGGERPCPFVSCPYHLYLDVDPYNGSIKLNFPDLEVWEMTESCALDVADQGGVTLEAVGDILNVTRERIRQIEAKTLDRLRPRREVKKLKDYVGEDVAVERRLPVVD